VRSQGVRLNDVKAVVNSTADADAVARVEDARRQRRSSCENVRLTNRGSQDTRDRCDPFQPERSLLVPCPRPLPSAQGARGLPQCAADICSPGPMGRVDMS
jgi:hypothetical protein